MPEDKNTVDFLNNIDTEVFKEEPVEVEEKEVQEEDKLPFHKDPKILRFIEKEVSKRVPQQSAEQQFKEDIVSSDVEDVVGAFTAIIGNDTPEKVRALKALEKTLNGSDERASAKAIERFEQKQQEILQQNAAADRAAVEELESSFEEIEETYNVDLSSNSASAKKQRAEFIEYIRKISPKDKETGEVNGFPDLVGAFEDFQERSKRTPTRAKELASRGLTRSTDASTVIPTGRSWKDVDRFFSKLKEN